MPTNSKKLIKDKIHRILGEDRATKSGNATPTHPSNQYEQKKTKRESYAKQQNKDILSTRRDGKKTEQDLSSCLITTSTDPRMEGGENNPAVRRTGILPRTDSECMFESPGIDFLLKSKRNLYTHEVKLNPSQPVRKELKNKCDYFPKYVDKRPFKDQITQTLYRESSAQTLPYLPEVAGAGSLKNPPNTFELFALPSVLDGMDKPGLYEVEILERARKRWAFKEALKANFGNFLKEAREMAIKTKHLPILQAFEWEQWIEREEYIQECQMMRLEIVIKMFDKREKEMRLASKSRIEQACEQIEQRRKAGLRKNELEFQRGMRRLEIQVKKLPRRYEKQSPLEALGSPSSEFYAPLIRHGVDPARRSFVPLTQRKAFDRRIDHLEKQVNMTNFKCPIRKLMEWSKPKEYVREYEQNFCNDDNLQRLFECLKTLRTQSSHVKEDPKCLVKRRKKGSKRGSSQLNLAYLANLYEHDRWNTRQSENVAFSGKYPTSSYNEAMKDDIRRQEIENMLNLYESSFVGWMMQFLSDEMSRLMQQRKLHFFCMMAQKERWRRECLEAGLRQKENEIREVYEEIFQQTRVATHIDSQEYIEMILSTDMYNVAEGEAAESTTELAKQIDQDIARWLESFKLVQNPINFVPLRLMLKDMVSPDLDAALQSHEKNLIAQYIVEDVLFPRMWKELDPIDIASTLTSDLIDRLIDNDLYLFSTDSESEGPQKSSWFEAHAIIRKLIRQAVPGQRWNDEEETIVIATYNDLFDDIFRDIVFKMEHPIPVESTELIHIRAAKSHKAIRASDNIRELDNIDLSAMAKEPSQTGSEFMSANILSLLRKNKEDKITRELVNLDKYHDNEPVDQSDYFIAYEKITQIEKVPQDLFDVLSIQNVIDIQEEADFKVLRGNRNKVAVTSLRNEAIEECKGEASQEEASQEEALQEEALKSIREDSAYSAEAEEASSAGWKSSKTSKLILSAPLEDPKPEPQPQPEPENEKAETPELPIELNPYVQTERVDFSVMKALSVDERYSGAEYRTSQDAGVEEPQEPIEDQTPQTMMLLDDESHEKQSRATFVTKLNSEGSKKSF